MTKVSLMYFKKDCMGCRACEVACKQENGLGTGPRLVRIVDKSPDFIPIYCHHCADAPCKKSCPEDAIYKEEQGIVLIDNEKCIGCRECLEACPFGAMQFDDETEMAVKCDMCINRLKDNQQPACSSSCATVCIFFGSNRELSDRLAEMHS